MAPLLGPIMSMKLAATAARRALNLRCRFGNDGVASRSVAQKGSMYVQVVERVNVLRCPVRRRRVVLPTSQLALGSRTARCVSTGWGVQSPRAVGGLQSELRLAGPARGVPCDVTIDGGRSSATTFKHGAAR